MGMTIQPGLLSGTVQAPPSKSCAHRILICAALSPAPTAVACGPVGKDVQATIACLQALGATIEKTSTGFQVSPIEAAPRKATLPCGESGSTLRFLLPLAGALGVEAAFLMEGRLSQRPLSPLWEEMERMGCQLSRPSENSILCTGRLRVGAYQLPGTVSSQFISGLLMAQQLLPGSSLSVTGKLESRPYVALTRAIMQKFPTACLSVEGDWSNAAFFLASTALGNQVTVTGLDATSVQGDQAIIETLGLLDRSPILSAADIPDLIPILAVVAACKQGATFTDIARLRLKESDRVEAIAQMLHALGGGCQIGENTLQVFPAKLTGGIVDAQNDHRIAMAAAIAATVAQGPVTILGAQCVEKSYPGFWDDFKMLGGKL